MSKGYDDMRVAAATVALAGILWFATFYLAAGVFWYKIAASAFIMDQVVLAKEGHVILVSKAR